MDQVLLLSVEEGKRLPHFFNMCSQGCYYSVHCKASNAVPCFRMVACSDRAKHVIRMGHR